MEYIMVSKSRNSTLYAFPDCLIYFDLPLQIFPHAPPTPHLSLLPHHPPKRTELKWTHFKIVSWKLPETMCSMFYPFQKRFKIFMHAFDIFWCSSRSSYLFIVSVSRLHCSGCSENHGVQVPHHTITPPSRRRVRLLFRPGKTAHTLHTCRVTCRTCYNHGIVTNTFWMPNNPNNPTWPNPSSNCAARCRARTLTKPVSDISNISDFIVLIALWIVAMVGQHSPPQWSPSGPLVFFFRTRLFAWAHLALSWPRSICVFDWCGSLSRFEGIALIFWYSQYEISIQL